MRIDGPRGPSDLGGQQNSYQVKEGDTLKSIGDKLNINADDLAKANGLSSDSKLSPGIELLLPAVQVTDQASQGLGSIADKLEPAFNKPGEDLGIKFHDQMPENVTPGENLGIKFHDQMPQGTARPGEEVGIKFHDQLPEGASRPGENVGIKFHDLMPEGVRDPGENIGIKFHDQMPVNLSTEMMNVSPEGQLLVDNKNLAQVFKSLNPDENIGIKMHDQLPEAGRQAQLGGRGPEEVGIKFHDQIPGSESASGETANIGVLPNFSADMFQVTDQDQLVIKNDDLARAFRSLLDSTQGSASFDVVAIGKKSE